MILALSGVFFLYCYGSLNGRHFDASQTDDAPKCIIINTF